MILDYSFAVQLNFSNFRNFGNKWFALFRILSQIVQVSQIRILQGFANTSFAVLRLFSKPWQAWVLQGFANASLARFRKYKFHKNLQICFSFRKVSQGSQGFRNGMGNLLMAFRGCTSFELASTTFKLEVQRFV